MEWNQEDIRKDFHGVIKDSYRMTEGELVQKYPNFNRDFPKLYSIAIDSVKNSTVQESLKLFEMMLSKRQQQIDGLSDKMVSDMFVGNQLGRKFIYPKTGAPSQEDYNKAVKKVLNGDALKSLEKSLNN